jgi:hypothetical protein
MRNQRKPKTVTTPRVRVPVPSPLALSSGHGFRAVLPALVLSALGFGRIATLASAMPPDQRHEKPYALIFGTVWGPDDHPLYGVKVKIRRVDRKKAHWELYSDHNGEFAQKVPAGRALYLVQADLKGYKYHTSKELKLGAEVKVHIENDERADIGLHLK